MFIYDKEHIPSMKGNLNTAATWLVVLSAVNVFLTTAGLFDLTSMLGGLGAVWNWAVGLSGLWMGYGLLSGN